MDDSRASIKFATKTREHSPKTLTHMEKGRNFGRGNSKRDSLSLISLVRNRNRSWEKMFKGEMQHYSRG